MDKENKNNKKQKVKIKANTTENSKLILNKEFILNKKYETLILKNEVKTNESFPYTRVPLQQS